MRRLLLGRSGRSGTQCFQAEASRSMVFAVAQFDRWRSFLIRAIICRWVPAAVALCLAPLGAGQAPSKPAEKSVDFNRDIRPVFSDACFSCHGPEEGSRLANLRLDSEENVFADRGGYRIIVPGNSLASRLYQRISSPEKASRMPPVSS